MVIKTKYIVQPYYVGAKEKKSVAIIIPAEIVKKYNFNPLSTIFCLKVNQQTNELYLKEIDIDETKGTTRHTNKFLIPTDESFQPSSQQVSSEAQ